MTARVRRVLLFLEYNARNGIMADFFFLNRLYKPHIEYIVFSSFQFGVFYYFYNTTPGTGLWLTIFF